MNVLHVPLFSGEGTRLTPGPFCPLTTETRRRDSRFSPRRFFFGPIKKSTGAFLSVWTRVSGMSNRGLRRVGLRLSRSALRVARRCARRCQSDPRRCTIIIFLVSSPIYCTRRDKHMLNLHILVSIQNKFLIFVLFVI